MQNIEQTIIKIARLHPYCSTATTAAGAKRAIMTVEARKTHPSTLAEIIEAYWPKVTPLPLDAAPRWSDTREAYISAEKLRKADPEAKRAKHDPKYRANWLRRLSRQEAALLAPPQRTLAEITAAADSRADRNAALADIARQRKIAGIDKPALVDDGKNFRGVEIQFSRKLAEKHGAKINITGKDATLQATRRSSYGVHVKATPSVKCNGKWRGYERAQHDNYVRSFGLISEDRQTLHYALHTTEYALTLPTGSRWDIDTNGVKAVTGPDDYHVRAEDLVAKNAVEIILGKIAANAATREQMAAQKAVEAAEMAGVYVCLADSLRSGNCRAGSESFAIRHGLDPRRHYSAGELLAMGNGDTGRVRLAIRAATNRHNQEIERGYALLTDHSAN